MQTVERDLRGLYGQIWESSFEMPELQTVAAATADFTVGIRALKPRDALQWSDFFDYGGDRGSISVAVEDDMTLWFRFGGGTHCRCSRAHGGGWEILLSDVSVNPDATTRHILIDEVIPTLLVLSDYSVLHGAAVVIDSAAVVILGGSGMGKSTLSCTLAKKGALLLSDDCAVVKRDRGRFMVQSSYPSVRLWATSARHVLGTDRGGLPFAENIEKRRYNQGLRFATDSAPLGCVVVLNDSPDDAPSLVALKELSGHAACAAIMGAAKTLPAGTGRVAAVDGLLDLAESVPVAGITVPDDLNRLSEVCDVIRSWADGC